jgi:hypothetical protein
MYVLTINIADISNADVEYITDCITEFLVADVGIDTDKFKIVIE